MSVGPTGPVSVSAESVKSNGRLSYKFQRLREDIRRAVKNGEFSGRLPGERTLGRRFGANAKTINKALSDLTAEGLLIRQIGRGTFVAERSDSALCDQKTIVVTSGSTTAADLSVIEQLTAGLAPVETVQVCPDRDGQCPASAWPTARRRDTRALIAWAGDALSERPRAMQPRLTAELHRRQTPFVFVGAGCPTERANAIVPDYSEAAYRTAEHLIQCGCKTLVAVAVEQPGREVLTALAAIQAACVRYGAGHAGPVTPAHFATNIAMHMGGNGRVASTAAETGVVCIGAAALKAVLARRAADTAGAGSMRCAAILAPGQRMPATPGVTTFEWTMESLAARLNDWLSNARLALPPKEMLVPGALFPRHPLSRRVERDETDEPARTPAVATRGAVEAVR